MQPASNGFPPYGFSAVVKFGGSLMRDLETCRTVLADLEQIRTSGHRIMIVPGGGIPDKAIEAVDSSYPLDAFTAHHACALAQDQTGYMIADPAFSSNLVPCSTLGECRLVMEQGRIPVLLPSRILFALDPVEWSWDITSDAIAAWIAWLTSTNKLAVLTDVDGVYRNGRSDDPSALIPEIAPDELARLGHTSIDACAAQFMARRGLSGVVLNGAFPQRLRDWLEGREVTGTLIRQALDSGGERQAQPVRRTGQTRSVGLTVYGPDVAKSGLTSALDRFIAQEGKLEVCDRFFAIHSRRSIEAFYSLTNSSGGKHWPLVVDLFDMRPVCATLWIGNDALSNLQNLKGKAQPAQAAKGTIRSRFFCDNPVTNLVHVSDSDGVMREELRILRAHSIGTDETTWRALNTGQISHSSFRVLLAILGNSQALHSDVSSKDDDALSNARAAFELAESVAVSLGLAETVQRFFAGDSASLQVLLDRAGELSAWDRLLLEAGLLAMPYWNSLTSGSRRIQNGD
ncbi:nucleoside-diphosphate kinase [Sinorhizobium sp. 7-81]|uniref:amino acid kinase family protein n=1 Tax=Sinorhizobium sp. 8-89 TaxID=3049089 RepID=UPI0024C2BF83|nr:nucleoside-diphosphate kinase [Sinorhizobium sp. 8-89]MDK1494260.1 nucleoside-diphosphate kinase [Sinorhizobium sp. 8-89]